ncbi:pyruvate dehydrogenase (acetyl-transferring) E1 component subunit alpha [Haloarchaeobius amylolyticus]|uniref:pyruvate dehydrogenase (acetyl-transferring) E1 component subunit alpha n=1 Tax=Haloarchaeobius amylolyticus TaxID=1198296 RepID=UPI00226FB0E9|nr:pyruvate dehydrogenase (acetyl-transferring) E1 component subunit alpha [Haloarchaeobius amylolyticus]
MTDTAGSAELVRRLDEDGTPVEDGYEPPLADDRLVDLYRDMRLGRRFDDRMISLQRQGRMGTYASLAGQEGSQFGAMYAMDDADWLSYQYREHAGPIVRDCLAPYIRYWMGYEEGNAALVDHNIHPLNISIGSHIPHATGFAWAMKLRGDDAAVVCHFGDGATSEGDFHEGLNFAGVFDVPAVFVCNNNQWAISIPAERQTASATFAQKADAYGFEGVRVDGMDPLAMYEVTRDALATAKDPGEDESRPTLVEAVQYRFGAHTTADDPTKYRDEAEVDAWREKDPIARLEAFLRGRGLLDDERVEAIEAEVTETLAEAVDAAMAVDPDPQSMFADVYEEQTRRVAEDDRYLRALRSAVGDDAMQRDE